MTIVNAILAGGLIGAEGHDSPAGGMLMLLGSAVVIGLLILALNRWRRSR